MGKGGGKKKQTIGYHYGLSIHYAICKEADSIENVVASGVGLLDSPVDLTSGNVTMTVNKPAAFGGEDNGEGGVFNGTWYWEAGGPTQGQNPYLSTKQSPCPNYRHFMGLVLEKVVHQAFNPYIKAWNFIVKRKPKAVGDWDTTVVDTAIGVHANPAAIIYETLINTEWGAAIPSTKIDINSFHSAAQTLLAENFGLSTMLREENVKDFIDDILRHIDAVLVQNFQTGKLELKLLRFDYDPNTIPVIDDSNMLSLHSLERPQWFNQVNDLVLVYTEPTTLKEAAVNVQDVASIQSIGKQTQKRTFKAIQDRGLALTVAVRELVRESKLGIEIKGEFDATLSPVKVGDVVKVTLPSCGLSDVVCRVFEREINENGSVILVLKEDIYRNDNLPQITSDISQWTPPQSHDSGSIPTPTRYIDYPMTRWAWNRLKPIAPSTDQESAAVLVIARENDTVTGINYQIQVTVQNGATVNYPPVTGSGVAAAYGELAAFDEQALTLTINNGIDLDTLHDTDLIVVWENGNKAYNEIMEVKNLTTVTTTLQVKRGVIDTSPKAFTNPRFMCLTDASTEIMQGDAGDQYNYTVTEATAAGSASGPTEAGSLVIRQGAPYPPRNVQIAGGANVGTWVYFPASLDIGASKRIDLQWAHSNRDTEDTPIPPNFYDATGVTAETGLQYTVTIDVNGVNDVTDTFAANALPTQSRTYTGINAVSGDTVKVTLKSTLNAIDCVDPVIIEFTVV